MPAKPVRLSWELEAEASLADTWALFSDTDRYNHAVGFGFTFKDTPKDDGSVERTGTASVMGVRFVWDELPFEYRENEWYRIRRRFRSGPARQVTVTLRLAARGEKTAVRYVIEVTPTNALTRPLVQLELTTKTRPMIERVLPRMIARLSNPSVEIDRAPEPLSTEANRRLTEAVETMTKREVGERLAETLKRAPLSLQNQLHPLKLASLWRLSVDDTVKGLLEATSKGLLEMQWDLLCPMCRGAKLRTDTLPLKAPEVHCHSCNIRYDGSFSDAISVSFRPTESLRVIDISPACIGSPSLQPQVLGQDNAENGQTTVFNFDLTPGAYRIRTIPSRHVASILVEQSGQDTECRFTVTHQAIAPQRAVLKPGPVYIAVQNDSFHRITLCLDKRHLPEHVLTAGQLLQRYGMSGEIPEWVFDPSQSLRTRTCCVAAVQVSNWAAPVLDALKRWSQAAPSRRLREDGSTVVVAFDEVSAAMTALAPLLGHKDMAVALASGEVIEASSEAFTTQFGDAVEGVLLAASACRPGAAMVLATSEPTMRPVMAELGWALDTAPTALGRDLLAYTALKTA